MPSSIPSNTDPQAGDEFVNLAGSLITVLGRDGEEVPSPHLADRQDLHLSRVRHCARWAVTNLKLPERFHNVYRNKIGVGFTTSPRPTARPRTDPPGRAARDAERHDRDRPPRRPRLPGHGRRLRGLTSIAEGA